MKQLGRRSSSSTKARALSKRIRRWHDKFIKALQKEPSVKNAAKSAGIDRTTAYKARLEDAEFAARWKDAIQHSVDDLETVAFKLATKGEPRLIEFLLRCHRPEIYRERTEMGIVGGVLLVPSKTDGAE